MHEPEPLHLFTGFGVELEYMIVSENSLDVLPLADRVLHSVSGSYDTEVNVGPLSWSNELALHVIELKTGGPARSLVPLPELFQHDIDRINAILANSSGRLMPGGMHPWMNPLAETRLWPHQDNAIYDAYNRIFDCRGHGWSNLQSIHLNLPFYDDEEFARLHAAIRLVLPLLPALAASTPIMDGRMTGISDNRLAVYRANQKKIPFITGAIIPEPAFSRQDYEQMILTPLYREIAPYDPEGILRYEWLNSRGAIARFDRSTIEIRLLDIQECPLFDIAILAFISEIIRALADETLADTATQQSIDTAPLADILGQCIVSAESAKISDSRYMNIFGYSKSDCTAGDLLRFLAGKLIPDGSRWEQPISHILSKGTLASRIISAIGGDLRRERIKAVYAELCRCLEKGEAFDP